MTSLEKTPTRKDASLRETLELIWEPEEVTAERVRVGMTRAWRAAIDKLFCIWSLSICPTSMYDCSRVGVEDPSDRFVILTAGELDPEVTGFMGLTLAPLYETPTWMPLGGTPTKASLGSDTRYSRRSASNMPVLTLSIGKL